MYVDGLCAGAEPAAVPGVVHGGSQGYAQGRVRYEYPREAGAAVHYIFSPIKIKVDLNNYLYVKFQEFPDKLITELLFFEGLSSLINYREYLRAYEGESKSSRNHYENVREFKQNILFFYTIPF